MKKFSINLRVESMNHKKSEIGMETRLCELDSMMQLCFCLSLLSAGRMASSLLLPTMNGDVTTLFIAREWMSCRCEITKRTELNRVANKRAN